jgi:hypothetical protein
VAPVLGGGSVFRLCEKFNAEGTIDLFHLIDLQIIASHAPEFDFNQKIKGGNRLEGLRQELLDVYFDAYAGEKPFNDNRLIGVATDDLPGSIRAVIGRMKEIDRLDSTSRISFFLHLLVAALVRISLHQHFNV